MGVIAVLIFVGIGMKYLLFSISSNEGAALSNGESGAPVTGGVITGGAISVDEGNGILTRFWRWVTGSK